MCWLNKCEVKQYARYNNKNCSILFIVILQYVFRQYNNIIINVLL